MFQGFVRGGGGGGGEGGASPSFRKPKEQQSDNCCNIKGMHLFSCQNIGNKLVGGEQKMVMPSFRKKILYETLCSG